MWSYAMPYMAHSIVAFHSIVTFLELNGASDGDFVPKINIEFWECSEGNNPIMEGAIHESSYFSSGHAKKLQVLTFHQWIIMNDGRPAVSNYSFYYLNFTTL